MRPRAGKCVEGAVLANEWLVAVSMLVSTYVDVVDGPRGMARRPMQVMGRQLLGCAGG